MQAPIFVSFDSEKDSEFIFCMQLENVRSYIWASNKPQNTQPLLQQKIESNVKIERGRPQPAPMEWYLPYRGKDHAASSARKQKKSFTELSNKSRN